MLVLVPVLAGCGSGRPASAPAHTSTAPPLPPGRIAFRRWLDDTKTHGAIFVAALERVDGDDGELRDLSGGGWRARSVAFDARADPPVSRARLLRTSRSASRSMPGQDCARVSCAAAGHVE
jgi:hypothetical protein